VAAEVPLALAEAAADVALLAADATERADGASRADAAAAAALAAGAAPRCGQAGRDQPLDPAGDERVVAAERAVETAEDAAKAALGPRSSHGVGLDPREWREVWSPTSMAAFLDLLLFLGSLALTLTAAAFFARRLDRVGLHLGCPKPCSAC
jgi:hypothetical protein